MSGTIATGSAPGGSLASTTTRVCSWAFSPYASHHARWKAHCEKGVAHGFRSTRPSQVASEMLSNGRRSTRKERDEDGSAVGVFAGPGQAGSASSVGVTLGEDSTGD